MSNPILTTTDTKATFTMTLASLATASARQSTMIDNSTLKRPAAMIYLKITSGAAAPTVGTSYDVYLLRANAAVSPDYYSDGAGASDAAITIQNAKFLGSMIVTASAATAFYGEFDTSAYGPLGPYWGIAVKNNSAQTVSTTEGDHYKGYLTYYPEVS